MPVLRWGATTDPGRVRTENEDTFVTESMVFAVADGMGGHQAGEVASALAASIVRDRLGNGATSEDAAAAAVGEANAAIYGAARANPAQRGMGTTLTAIVVLTEDTDDGEERMVLLNVGDSRTYRFRAGRLQRVTVDHSYVQELVAAGHISIEEARTHPRRNIVTRALGIEPVVRADMWTLPIVRGDRYVLASDGLVDEVPDSEILDLVASVQDPQQLSQQLVEIANRHGGRDNVTVVVVDVIEGGDPPDPTDEMQFDPAWAEGVAEPAAWADDGFAPPAPATGAAIADAPDALLGVGARAQAVRADGGTSGDGTSGDGTSGDGISGDDGDGIASASDLDLEVDGTDMGRSTDHVADEDAAEITLVDATARPFLPPPPPIIDGLSDADTSDAEISKGDTSTGSTAGDIDISGIDTSDTIDIDTSVGNAGVSTSELDGSPPGEDVAAEEPGATATAIADSTAIRAVLPATAIGVGAGAAAVAPASGMKIADSVKMPPGAAATPAKRRRRFSAGVFLFIFFIAAILTTTITLIAVQARSGYFVGFDGDTVVVYKGQRDNVLWFEPTVNVRSDTTRDDLSPEVIEAVEARPTFDSASEAAAFVQDEVIPPPTTEPATTVATTVPATDPTTPPAPGETTTTVLQGP